METSMDSKTKILESSINVFAKKGMHGARMEDIGKVADINKAMVYYYYSSKENLFQEALNMIVKRIYTRIISGLRDVHGRTDDPVEIIEEFARLHFQEYSRNRDWTRLLMDVLSDDPGKIETAFKNAFSNGEIQEHDIIEQSFKEGVRQGIFRDVDFTQVFISIVGMNLIYFLARPIAETILNNQIKNEDQFLHDRENSIVGLLLYGIKN
ncbi:MAG: TetR family transcriptional regulator [Candidatus Marinimicrobia bacterium]|nr:TetR family transcriptional regulator [Candidatus Neomarinimicrobiota bacterium]